MTFFQGFYSLIRLFVATSPRWHILVVLVLQGLHLHLFKRARRGHLFLVLVARCRNLSSPLILLVAVGFFFCFFFYIFFWKSYIVKACWSMLGLFVCPLNCSWLSPLCLQSTFLILCVHSVAWSDGKLSADQIDLRGEQHRPGILLEYTSVWLIFSRILFLT